MPPYEPVEIRFWKYVRKTHACWLWTAGRNACGYGLLGRGRGKSSLAHRISWEINIGEIPKGLCVLHRCDIPHCVRPDHLWIGTQGDNIWDMVVKGRRSYDNMIGIANPRGKLTDTQVRRIRHKYLKCGGRSDLVPKIAKEFGVTRQCVWQIGTGRSRSYAG